MAAMNLNRVFPRLSIRAKLVIAFSLLAIFPLVVVMVFATRTTVRHLLALAEATLEHDLEMAEHQTERALQQVGRDVDYLATAVLSRLLEDSPGDREAAQRSVAAFLNINPTLFQINVVDPDGRIIFQARQGSDTQPSRGGEELDPGGMYYAVRANALAPDERLMLPVELRNNDGSPSGMTTIPAVAIVLPVRGPDGSIRGTVVGEAYASSLFAGLESGSPQVSGVTGLVSADGLILYHSTRKSDWSSLLVSRAELDLVGELSEQGIAALQSGVARTITTPAEQIVSFVPLHLGQSGLAQPMLYRIVPLAMFEGSARDFRRLVTFIGSVVLFFVFGLAMLAARQFTEPIHQLRRGARRLIEGKSDEPLRIETNDELEDLAADFSTMAASLSQHRKQLEELIAERTKALHETDAKLAEILEHSADAIIGLDLGGCIRVWNSGAESLFGYTAAEVLGKEGDALLLPPGVETKLEAEFVQRELIEQGSVINLQCKRLARNDEVLSVSLTQTLIRDEDGEPLGYSLIIRDTRKQAELEEQMRRSEGLAAASVMAAGLAHEFNNPLAVLGNRIECMQEDVIERCDRCFLEEDLAVLGEHTTRLSEVTRDLLRFVQAEDDEVEPLALDQMAFRLVRLLKQTFSSRSIGLAVVTHEKLLQPQGREKAIEVVCMNLLLNAADATPPGGLVTLEVRNSESNGAVQIEVRDTGPGIPAELRHRIFEPFFTTKAEGRGTGLGLAVCRNIVERHGGQIEVYCPTGGGSRFVVTLPVQQLGVI